MQPAQTMSKIPKRWLIRCENFFLVFLQKCQVVNIAKKCVNLRLKENISKTNTNLLNENHFGGKSQNKYLMNDKSDGGRFCFQM